MGKAENEEYSFPLDPAVPIPANQFIEALGVLKIKWVHTHQTSIACKEPHIVRVKLFRAQTESVRSEQ